MCHSPAGWLMHALTVMVEEQMQKYTQVICQGSAFITPSNNLSKSHGQTKNQGRKGTFYFYDKINCQVK